MDTPERLNNPSKSSPQKTPSQAGALRSLLLGGVLPVIVFTVLEEKYGTLWGLVGGMILGFGEIANEWRTQRKVDTITWIGNGLLIGMGLISLFTSEGLWFKLQPAILEAFMAVLLIGSVIVGKPFLALMAEKQNMYAQIPEPLHPVFRSRFKGMTFRIGIFFLLHAILATWAAVEWSTRAWALLKGVGFTASMILYMLVEMLFLRRKL